LLSNEVPKPPAEEDSRLVVEAPERFAGHVQLEQVPRWNGRDGSGGSISGPSKMY
jgi:hypothetical protein